MPKLNSSLQRINDIDVALCLCCNRQSRHPYIRDIFCTVSRLGDGIFWYALMTALLLADFGRALPGVMHMLGAALAGTLIYKLIKHKTLRPRPFQIYPNIVCAGKTLDQFSFPSGHTMHAVSFSLIGMYYFPETVYLTLPFTVLVALSRPILGLHYPSDVLAGATLGALFAALSFLFV